MKTPKEVLVRPAKREDCRAIYDMVRELAEYEMLLDRVVSSPEQFACTLFGPHPSAHALIGEVDGQPAGICLYFFNYSTFLGKSGIYLEDLYVRAAYRGVGLGRKLLQSLAQVAVEKNVERVDWSVLEWNEPAIKFYEGIGAKMLGDWRPFRLAGPALSAFARGESVRPVSPAARHALQ